MIFINEGLLVYKDLKKPEAMGFSGKKILKIFLDFLF